MSRPATGEGEVLESARQAIAAAQSAEQLRQAQAVVLPLDYGLSLAETARDRRVAGLGLPTTPALHTWATGWCSRRRDCRWTQTPEHVRARRA